MTSDTARPSRLPRSPRLRSAPRRAAARLVGSLLALVLFASVSMPGAAASADRGSAVVVANRGSGDISVIDVDSLEVETVDLPGEAEPMYVSHDLRRDRIFVGDRANSTVVAFDEDTYDVVGSVEVGDGVFHQWLDNRLRQLWVVGDTSKTVSVVHSGRLELITTIDIPADLVERGGKPHDVFVSGRSAFVSIVGLDDGSGLVIRYSTRTFEETGRIAVGGDPHLFIDGGLLFVASQDASTVARYGVRTLAPRGEFTVPSAHGLFVSNRHEVFVTNIAGGGSDAVWELNRRLTRVVDTVNTAEPTPHNLTVDNQRQIWVTHSGATADQVSVIDLERRGFGGSRMVTVGTNPFGLAFIR